VRPVRVDLTRGLGEDIFNDQDEDEPTWASRYRVRTLVYYRIPDPPVLKNLIRNEVRNQCELRPAAK
jgi:hypothetical protein